MGAHPRGRAARLEGAVGRRDPSKPAARPRVRAEFLQSESLLLMKASEGQALEGQTLTSRGHTKRFPTHTGTQS